MKRAARLLPLFLLFSREPRHAPLILPFIGPTTVHRAAAHDLSAPLRSMRPSQTKSEPPDCGANCGTSPGDPDKDRGDELEIGGLQP